ncbi:uncharacterized protein LOC132276436 [Cornus florida]|uniref:uncharacterized protein LOC132276436 n=1 Tax=Cornus florida TaxID=4283 RepID=UPI00289DF496|nr:uncharacterized protein LOC132276436 [Cornus florida]
MKIVLKSANFKKKVMIETAAAAAAIPTLSASSDEEVVANILLDLPILIEARLRWGNQKRRSAPALPPPRRTERGPKFMVESSSPATPLSFPPSESDERPQQHKKPSDKRRERGQIHNIGLEIEKAQERPGQIPCLVHQQALIVNQTQTMFGGYRLVVPHESSAFDPTTRVVMLAHIRAKAAEARKHRMVGIKEMKRYMKPIAIK